MSAKSVSRREEAVDELLKTHTEFRKLHRRHQELEAELERMNGKSYLTPDEQMRRKQIQKEKLFEKDRMESIIRSCTAGASAA